MILWKNKNWLFESFGWLWQNTWDWTCYKKRNLFFTALESTKAKIKSLAATTWELGVGLPSTGSYETKWRVKGTKLSSLFYSCFNSLMKKLWVPKQFPKGTIMLWILMLKIKFMAYELGGADLDYYTDYI